MALSSKIVEQIEKITGHTVSTEEEGVETLTDFLLEKGIIEEDLLFFTLKDLIKVAVIFVPELESEILKEIELTNLKNESRIRRNKDDIMLNPLIRNKDQKMMKGLLSIIKEHFSDIKIEYVKSGISLLNKKNNKTIVTYNDLFISKSNDDIIVGSILFKQIKTLDELLKILPEEVKARHTEYNAAHKCAFVKNVPQSQFIEIITTIDLGLK